MPRILIEVPDELHRRVKAAAALEGLTLKAYVLKNLEQATQPTGSASDKRKRR